MLKLKRGLLAFLLLGGIGLAGLADEPAKPADSAALVLIDTAGKEQKLKTWKFTAGVQRMSWLAPEEKKPDNPSKPVPGKRARPTAAAVGPEALVVVDEMKIFLLPPVTTLVPLERVRSVAFDAEKKTMTVHVAAGAKPEDDVVFTCTTAYKNINKVTVEAEVDKGDAGLAEVVYQGGTLRGNIKEIRFPNPKPPADKPPAGRPAVVMTKDKMLVKEHKVSDLRPLYRLASGRDKLLDTLMFRKTLRLDVGKIKKLVPADEENAKWQVTQKSGDESTYTLIAAPTLDGGKATLVGLLGKVPGGYRLFPLESISSVTFDATEVPREPEKPRDPDGKCE